MKKITEKAVQALEQLKEYRGNNTQVVRTLGANYTMFLFGNPIAKKDIETGDIYISNAGWFSKTTKERLNGIQGVKIQQRDFVWYLNGKQWNGDWIRV